MVVFSSKKAKLPAFFYLCCMQLSAKELASLLNGRIEGNPEVLVNRPSKIEEGGAGSISFLGNDKYEAYAYTTNASILLVNDDFQPRKAIKATLIRVDNVYKAFAFLLEKFGDRLGPRSGVSAHAMVATDAQIGADVYIGPASIVEEGVSIGEASQIHAQTYIGRNVSIGKQVVIYPGVRIYHDCVIGNHCIIHANTVIGSDGFGFVPQADHTYQKISQIGNVVIEKDVEIGANTVIDRATIGSTIIRSGAKLDNLIQVGHNVEIGENTVIAAQTGIAGSTKIGKNCQIGGQVGFAGHLKIADGTRIQAQSGIGSNVEEPNTALFGYPAFAYRDYIRSYSVFRQLPDLYKRLHQLEKQLTEKNKA